MISFSFSNNFITDWRICEWSVFLISIHMFARWSSCPLNMNTICKSLVVFLSSANYASFHCFSSSIFGVYQQKQRQKIRLFTLQINIFVRDVAWSSSSSVYTPCLACRIHFKYTNMDITTWLINQTSLLYMQRVFLDCTDYIMCVNTMMRRVIHNKDSTLYNVEHLSLARSKCLFKLHSIFFVCIAKSTTSLTFSIEKLPIIEIQWTLLLFRFSSSSSSSSTPNSIHLALIW